MPVTHDNFQQESTADVSPYRAAIQMDLGLKIFHIARLGTPQERVTKRLGEARETIKDHLAESESGIAE